MWAIMCMLLNMLVPSNRRQHQASKAGNYAPPLLLRVPQCKIFYGNQILVTCDIVLNYADADADADADALVIKVIW